MEWRPECGHSFNPNDAYKLTTVGSGNGLSPARHQAIIRTNAEILLFRNKWINKRNLCIFIQENAFESVICEMVTILSRTQCVHTIMYAFRSDLEIVLNQMDNNTTTVLAGDMNIDIIKFSNEEVVSYMTTLMS